MYYTFRTQILFRLSKYNFGILLSSGSFIYSSTGSLLRIVSHNLDRNIKELISHPHLPVNVFFISILRRLQLYTFSQN